MISEPVLAFSPTRRFRLENGSAALTQILMEAVTGDPSLDSVSHEFEIENGLRVLRVLNELFRRALRTIARSGTLDGLIRGQDPFGPLGPSQSVLQVNI